MTATPHTGKKFSSPQSSNRSFLERLGLSRPEHWAWAMYEMATTGMWAVIVATIFPIYYQHLAAKDLPGAVATRNFAIATTVGIVLIAVVAPLMGAITDRMAIKKPLLGIFTALGVAGAGLLFFVQEGDWLLGLGFFILVNWGANGSTVFYDALLPHIARPNEVDRVSSGAFAIGYFGAGLLLAFCLFMIIHPNLLGIPQGTLSIRLSFVAVAVWWAVFAIPLFLGVKEPPPKFEPGETQERSVFRFAINRIVSTFRELKSYRHAFILLVGYFIYGDGIGTIIRMATVYGAEIGIEPEHMIGAIIMVQFVGVPFTFFFGMLADMIGTKRAIFLGLLVYMGITVLGYFMTSATHFWALAFLVGTVQGGTQALSRSLYSSMIPAYKAGELFGFYGVLDKFAGMIGPSVMAAVIALTGSSRLGILSVMLFFIVGALLLYLVDEEEGRRIAQEAQEKAQSISDENAPSSGTT
jgi:MFS transporter, UMF1 family